MRRAGVACGRSPFLWLHPGRRAVRRAGHINSLMREHERAFSEIKNYYNDITHNNLDLIR